MDLVADYIIVSNRASAELGEKIAGEMGLTLSSLETKTFADGERYHAFPGSIAGKHLIVIGATHTEDSFQELLDIVQGGRYWNAQSVNVVVPYLGYSTMERSKPNSYEIPKGITRTRQLFRSRPDFVAFLDLHSEAVLHAHSGDTRTKHIWSESLAAGKVKELGLNNYVLVSPDYGFSKRVARLASILDCPHTAADKDRYDTDKTIVHQVSSVVKGKTAVICDDMIRTGSSIIQTAERCLDAGASEVVVMATHLVLAGDAVKKFKQSPITRIIGSDSYPGRVCDDLIDVYSVAPKLASVLQRHLHLV